MRQTINTVRAQALQKGWAVAAAGSAPAQPTDFVINADEAALAKEAEQFETILGTLDGQLSLKNATVTIDI